MSMLTSPFTAEPMVRADAVELAKVVKALADPARLLLLSVLHQHAEETVGGLAPLVGLTQPTISHHMKILKLAGLVHREVDGPRVFYTLNRQAIAEVAGLLNPPRRAASRGGSR
jgi:ArsR family transcriptional regulator, arsenate/arsenite/antimonite-responsive transcriptional repressor